MRSEEERRCWRVRYIDECIRWHWCQPRHNRSPFRLASLLFAAASVVLPSPDSCARLHEEQRTNTQE